MIDKNSWLYTKPIAHRGLHNEKYPENSLEAFREAMKHNYAIELDVHLLKDGNLAVFHDYDTFRMTGIKNTIENLTKENLIDYKLGNTLSHIPLLEDVFALIDGKTEILIEIKSGKHAGIIERKLAEIIKNYRGETAVQSFYPFNLYNMKKADKTILRGQLASDFKNSKENVGTAEKFVSKNLLLNFLTKPDFVAFDIDGLPNKKVTAFRKSKGPVLGYTVDNMKKLLKAEKYCDNVIFEKIVP